MPVSLLRQSVYGVVSLALAFVMPAIPQAASASSLPGDPYIGRQLAEAWCASCHKVTPGAAEGFSKAPAFQKIAETPAYTEMALRAFLRSPHDEMPDVILTPAQSDHIIAYILSLAKE